MFEFNGTPYPDELLDSIQELLALLSRPDSALREKLATALDEHEIDSLLRRAEGMVKDRVFPVLDPDWNVPWPMI